MEPWFDPMYAWVPGTIVGCLAGLMGGLGGWLAPKGKAKGFILPMWWLLLLSSGVLLAAGIFGYLAGQPYGIWYGLCLTGLIGVLVLGINLPILIIRYRQAEQRRMHAHDLS